MSEEIEEYIIEPHLTKEELAKTAEAMKERLDLLFSDPPAWRMPLMTHQHHWQVTVSSTHTAARWCVSCGETYASTFAGNPQELQWHLVKEAESREEK